MTRVAFLFNPATAPYAEIFLNTFKAAAASFSFAVEGIVAPFLDTAEIELVVAAQAREPNGGLIVMPSAFATLHRMEITSLASRYSIPAVYPFRFFSELGGLLSYGNDFVDNFRRGVIRRSHTQGREAERASRTGPSQVRAGYQPKDCEGARSGSALTPAATADEVIE